MGWCGRPTAFRYAVMCESFFAATHFLLPEHCEPDSIAANEPPASLWTLRNVCVAGRRTERLRVDALVVRAGTTAIIGPSGAGKSTLVDLLCGVIEPDVGVVEASDCARSLFFGGSDGGLWPDEPAGEHLRLVCSNSDRVHELLGRFELDDCAQSRPEELSQGQRTRLSIARALAADPQTIVLDEPLAHVDPRRRGIVRDALREWAEADPSRSLIVATHAADWVADFDRTICLESGAVVADGPTDALRREPPSETVAWSLGIRSLAALLLCVWTLAGLAGCDAAAATIPVEQARTYQLPPDGPRLPAPRAVTIDAADNRFILDNAGRVLVYSPAGKLLRRWDMPDSSIGKPEGIRVFPDGRVAVADTHYSRVVVFRPDGRIDFMFGSRGEGPGQFIFPVAIEYDDAGNLYVAEYGGHDRVQKFAPDGTFLLQFGSPGSGPGEFQRPSGLQIAGDTVWVADAINNRVHRFATDGTFEATLDTDSTLDGAAPLHWPYDMARDASGQIVLPEFGSGTVAVIEPSGRLTARYGEIGRDLGQFYTPWGLAIDSRGTIIVADTGNHRIVEFQP